ncbi:MAG TPA: hypothetical protein GX396_04245 [Tissierellia bacterium]|jgi:hypothetical protein|nr:hypothetical protein [Tissierellia bacterium]
MGFDNCNDVAGRGGRRRDRDFGRRCECVFECLLDLLEDALDDRDNRRCCERRNWEGLRPGGDFRRRCDCECVFECLLNLLEDELDDDDFCRCPR